ncbi:DUF928 domain-containing protein [Phormidium sp. FACHB-1136]|uniref:DUF928 domain-containing protein n=1 Tax=Phormidium sp. FACHB-1136 TaxID=2692848 RepID=UPI001687EB73|nr:DUF928 domain-containing protein [Phormidium sp. FACHB-1136]MBD2427326.1 DUF928 domain-containing protein [Phormidium sp. FACHB-1136]
MTNQWLGLFTMAIGLSLANSPSLANPHPIPDPMIYAQGAQPEGFWVRTWQRLRGRSIPNQRSGSTGRGGANHDRCLYTTEELLALVPTAAETGLPYLEPVLTGHPTWWFYVPYAGNGRLRAEFALIDTAETILYTTEIILPPKSGLMAVSWPETEPPLSPGSTYRWVFSIRCNPTNRSGDATVNGWIQRATAEESAALATQLAAAPNPYAVLADSLYWFDLLATLNTLKTTNPQRFSLLWDGLLCQVYAQSDRLTALTETCPDLSSLPEPN